MMAGIRAACRFLVRLVVAVAFALAVVLVPSVASYAAIPPYPSTGGEATGWTCTGKNTPPGLGETETTTTQTCTVNGWAADPAPVAPDAGTTSGEVVLADDQWQVIAFGLGLVVLLGSARLVGSWKS